MVSVRLGTKIEQMNSNKEAKDSAISDKVCSFFLSLIRAMHYCTSNFIVEVTKQALKKCCSIFGVGFVVWVFQTAFPP